MSQLYHPIAIVGATEMSNLQLHYAPYQAPEFLTVYDRKDETVKKLEYLMQATESDGIAYAHYMDREIDWLIAIPALCDASSGDELNRRFVYISETADRGFSPCGYMSEPIG